MADGNKGHKWRGAVGGGVIGGIVGIAGLFGIAGIIDTDSFMIADPVMVVYLVGIVVLAAIAGAVLGYALTGRGR